MRQLIRLSLFFIACFWPVSDASAFDLNCLGAATDGFVIEGIDTGEFSGGPVSAAGDINGDSFDDLIIGSEDHAQCHVIFGGANSWHKRDSFTFRA